MFVKRDFDLLRVSDAVGGPMIVSEDLMRCMLLYDINEYPSVRTELKFLGQFYGKNLAELLRRRQFVVCEYMDIVWAGSEIEDEWVRQQYFMEKASYLKSLRDNLELVSLYGYYEDLEMFELLDVAFDVSATLKELGDNSPISWLKNAPVTTLHHQLRQDAANALQRLPDQFGCLGYNFTKTKGEVCMQDGCGLSLYKSAEFDFSKDGIMLNLDNISLFNCRKMEQNLTSFIGRKGDFDSLAATVDKFAASTSPLEKLDLDPLEFVYDLFCKTQKETLNPLTGNKKALGQVLNIFAS